MKTKIKLTEDQERFAKGFNRAEADGVNYYFIPVLFIETDGVLEAASLDEAPSPVLNMLGIGYTPVEETKE